MTSQERCPQVEYSRICRFRGSRFPVSKQSTQRQLAQSSTCNFLCQFGVHLLNMDVYMDLRRYQNDLGHCTAYAQMIYVHSQSDVSVNNLNRSLAFETSRPNQLWHRVSALCPGCGDGKWACLESSSLRCCLKLLGRFSFVRG